VDEHGFTPFMVACQYGHADIVEMFLGSFEGLQINARTKTRPTTALILAIKGHLSDLLPGPAEAGDISGRNQTRTPSEAPAPSPGPDTNMDSVGLDDTERSEGVDQHLVTLMREISIMPPSPSTSVSLSTQHHSTGATAAGSHSNSLHVHINSTSRSHRPDAAGVTAEKAGSRLRIVKSLLLRPDLDINAQDDEGYTALMYAAKLGLQSLVECLLSHPDISVNSTTFKTNTTALMLACAGGHRGVVELLLARPDVDVEVRDSSERSALTISVDVNQDKDIIVALLRAISRASLKSSNRTPTITLVL
jgi:ankyrin repeat protein